MQSKQIKHPHSLCQSVGCVTSLGTSLVLPVLPVLPPSLDFLCSPSNSRARPLAFFVLYFSFTFSTPVSHFLATYLSRPYLEDDKSSKILSDNKLRVFACWILRFFSACLQIYFAT